MHSPGTMIHSARPVWKASLFSAQYSIVPQLTVDGSPSPMNCRLEENSTAYSALVRKLATSSDVIVGMISTTMMYSDRSPLTLAACRKSRLRRDSAWDRSWRAVKDHPVAVMTTIMTRVPTRSEEHTSELQSQFH